MSFLSQRKIEIPESRYRADMELHDRFQALSAELLKLSLAGVAVVGFFLATISGGTTLGFVAALDSSWFIGAILLAVAMFSLSAALSLAHRFLASDGMYHHLRAIKHLIVRDELSEHEDLTGDDNVAKRLSELAKGDEIDRNTKFNWSERCLYGSAISLVLAASSLGFSFMVLLNCPRHNTDHSTATEAAAGPDSTGQRSQRPE